MKDISTLERRKMQAELSIENERKEVERISERLVELGIPKDPSFDVDAHLSNLKKQRDDAKERYEALYDKIDKSLTAAEEALR